MAGLSDTNKLVFLYNNELMKTMDKYVPKRKIKITVRNKTPWTTDEIHPDKTLKCKLERKWLRTKLIIDEQNYKAQRNKYNALLRDLKAKRPAKDINENKNGLKRIHQIVGNALYLNNYKPLPPNQADINQPKEFINYLDNKINHIRSTVEGDDKSRTICKNYNFLKLNLMILKN